MNHFERLGLPGRFSVDAAELERSYLALSRGVHPDFHLTGADADRAASLEASALLNEAYTTLKDPFSRAEYLLTLEGGPTAAEFKQLPPGFLAEMLEARERVEMARGNPAEMAQLATEFETQFEGILKQVREGFARLASTEASEASNAPEAANLLTGIRGLLNAAKYVRGLLRDIQAD